MLAAIIIASDIRMNNGFATFLFVEPCNFAGNKKKEEVQAYLEPIGQAVLASPGESKAGGVLASGAQKSPGDCIEMCESYGKKLADEQAFFDPMHDLLQAGKPLSVDPIIPPAPWLIKESSVLEPLVSAADGLPPGIAYFAPNGRNFLPLSLYKHMGSVADAEQLIEMRSEMAEVKVNKERKGPKASLTRRPDKN